jgi:hypothetical protein
MARARRAEHLRNLQGRFPALAGVEIVILPNRDYGYRLIVPKSVWGPVLAEMAEEQEWSNLKNQVSKHQGKAGADYAHALHEVSEIIRGLQKPCANRWAGNLSNIGS